jgi:hypothetical protein
MAIFRGVGGSGDSSDNSFLQEVTAQANAASASAFSAATSAAAILNLTAATGDAGTDASYNPSTGVLTVPRGADGTDASVTAADVTGVLTGGTGISIASNGTITNDSPDQTVALTGTGATTITGTYPNFTINSVNTTYTVGDGGLTTNDFTDADHSKLNGIEANATADQTGAEIKSAYEAVADTNAYTDAEKTKLSGIEASADVTDTANVTSAGAAMLASSPTFTGTITAPNVDISTTGSVTTNIATGANGANNTDVKVVNIGTGYGGFYSGASTTINMGGQASSATNIFNIGNGTTSGNGENTINLKGNVNVDGSVGELDATVASPSQNTPILKLRKNSPNADGTGRFITLASSTSSGGTEITRGFIGLSNTTAPQYSNPYMSHTSGSNGISCTYSSNSSFNAITPCASTGIPTNGSLNLGHAYAKWNTVYASSGSINTSDITKKQDIEELSEAESRVAMAAKGLLRKYRWKESVVEKGDNARIHFGIMAQDLKAAFEAEGLDANKYGMFCADTRWTTDGTDTYATEEEAPEAVTEETVYGVRYEELLAFIIAAI